jgi:hypothetical protein
MSDAEVEGRAGELPPRLLGERGPEGDLVRRYLRRPHGASEERSWPRLEAALFAPLPARRRRPRRRWLAGLAAAVAAAGVWLLVPRWPAVPRLPPSARAPIESQPPAQAPARPEAAGAPMAIALGPRARVIPAGRWTIPGQASLEIGPGGAARARARAGRSPAVSLLRGRIALEVVSRPRTEPFWLTAGPYRFTVVGTAFAVERGPAQVTLRVSEGRVAVSSAGRPLTTVSAGGSWAGALSPAPTMDTGPGPEPDCAVLAAGLPRAAQLPCWRAQAAGAGLRAQNALFHIGRITEEDLREPSVALATFRELRLRFPRGPLRVETDLSIVQLLAATGRPREALEESAALLAQGSGAERAAELHLLRGNLYREALGDLAQAEREYRLASEPALTAPEADLDQALFLHAVTLEALGRHREAAEGYRRYLARGRPARAQEARTRLERIDQTSGVAPGSKQVEVMP